MGSYGSGRINSIALLVLWASPLAWGQATGADIVFIYDNSGSMTPHYAKLDALTGDTAFYYVQNCRSAGGGLPPTGAPFTYATFAGPRDLQWVDSAVTCNPPQAGDPYSARTAVVSRAIDILAARYPMSTAGAIAFAFSPGPVQPPLPLDVPGNVTQIKDSLVLDSISATNYLPPLRLATTWLRDTSLIRNAKQAIIFISDGEPNDASQLNSWLTGNTSIPIYCIALGDSESTSFPRMKDMSMHTGGRFYSVSPRDVDSMHRAIEQILEQAVWVPVALRPSLVPVRIRVAGSRVDASGRHVPAPAGPRFRYLLPR